MHAAYVNVIIETERERIQWYKRRCKERALAKHNIQVELTKEMEKDMLE